MSETTRQFIAIFAFIFLGPLLMTTSMKYADVVRYNLHVVKEEDDDELSD